MIVKFLGNKGGEVQGQRLITCSVKTVTEEGDFT